MTISINGNGSADDETGQHFILGQSGANFFLGWSYGDAITMLSNQQTVQISAGGADRVADLGQGNTIQDVFSKSMQIFDFQHDHTGKIQIAGFGTPTFTPDGHGGTTIGLGGFTIDVVGDAHVNHSQVTVFPARD